MSKFLDALKAALHSAGSELQTGEHNLSAWIHHLVARHEAASLPPAPQAGTTAEDVPHPHEAAPAPPAPITAPNPGPGLQAGSAAPTPEPVQAASSATAADAVDMSRETPTTPLKLPDGCTLATDVKLPDGVGPCLVRLTQPFKPGSIYDSHTAFAIDQIGDLFPVGSAERNYIKANIEIAVELQNAGGLGVTACCTYLPNGRPEGDNIPGTLRLPSNDRGVDLYRTVAQASAFFCV